ncbi:unnamed protein product, partial [Mesorhabditis spiculigera]
MWNYGPIQLKMDNPSLIYRPGEWVSGTMVLTLTKPCKSPQATIRLFGSAETEWQREIVNGKYLEKETYEGEIEIVDEEIMLWKNGRSDEIPVGTHVFRFQMQLPFTCLPSYEGNHGNIRYTVEAEVERHWRFSYLQVLPFTVVTFCDLNSLPDLNQPAYKVVNENTGIPLFRRGNIKVEAHMTKKGFISGDTIPIRLNINNESTKEMISKHSLASRKEGSFELTFKIPSVAATFQCALIRVYYMLKVDVVTGGTVFNSVIALEMPVVIGTIPLSLMKFFVVFNSNSRVFFPGQVVEGVVILQLSEETSARDISIKVTGHAKNHWTVSHTHTTTNSDGTTSSHTTTESYNASIGIFNGQSKAWGNGTKQKIPAGEHRYPFAFQLPVRCLPSYEGCYGHIRYEIRAEVDRPWKFNHKTSMPFTVVTISDLNLTPSLRTPLSNSQCIKTGLPLFRKGHVSVKVSIPKSGFVPGESIPITLRVENSSSKDMEAVDVVMNEHSDFIALRCGGDFPIESAFVHTHGGNQRRHHKRQVARMRIPLKIPKHSTAEQTVNLRIPAVATSFQCAIIQVYYNLKVTVSSAATFNSSVISKFPIVIGNVPMQTISYANPYVMQPALPAGSGKGPAYPVLDQPQPQAPVYPSMPQPQPPIAGGAIPSAPPEYASAPPLPLPANIPNAPPPDYAASNTAPPSYEQSVFGASAPTKEDEAFAPSYLYFNNFNMGPPPPPPSAPTNGVYSEKL